MILRSIGGLSLLFLLITGCFKEPEGFQPVPAAVDNIDKLVVPEGFLFETNYVQQITMVAQKPTGEPMKRILFMLYSAPPENGGVLIARGLTNAQGEFYAEITVSTLQQAVYAYTPYRDLVPAQRLELTQGNPIYHIWGSLPDASLEAVYKTIPQDGSFICNSTFFQVVGSTLKELDVLSGTYTTVGTASSNYNGIGFSPIDRFIYGIKGTSLWKLSNDGKETDLGLISGLSGGYNYRADFDTLGNLVAIAEKTGQYSLAIIDVDASPPTATEVSLTKIGIVAGNIHDLVYSPYFRYYYAMTMDAHLLRIDYENLTIEDIGNFSTQGMESGGAFGAGWTSSDSNLYWSFNTSGKIYQVEMDDSGTPVGASYVLTGDIASNNDGCSCVWADSPFTDNDGDGIPNGSDDFPEDSEVAFATFTPSEYGYGTYAFEDLWPQKGDYDFNDAVLGYHYIAARDTHNLAHKLYIKIQIKALGAGFQNGFGIQLEGLTPEDIQSVTGTVAPSIATTPGGCETGQSKAVIIVYDNGHTLMGARTGQLVNTGAPAGVTLDPIELDITVVFSSPQASIGEINPFIYTQRVRGNEIHLKGFPATDLVDNSLFGTFADASSGTNTYQTANGLPWALSFSTGFSYPSEKSSFLSAYPFFSTWVISSGSEQADWYNINKAAPAHLFNP
jgi:LruC domain-containing protein